MHNMAKMSARELKALLAAEKADALSGMSDDKLVQARTDAMDYYMGDMSVDMPAQDGRSSAVSTDVMDTIEGLMPSLMEIFAGSDEVVKFEPVGPEDVAAAEQETDYVNHVFMQKNPGFMVLYSFIKDALLSKNGFVKVYWEEYEEEKRETYLDKSQEEYEILAGNPVLDVVEHSARESEEYPGMKVHDITVVTKKTYQCAKVEGIPPEEFGISRNAKNIADCDYCFHEVLRSEHALVEQGFDEAQVKKLPSGGENNSIEDIARDTVNEGSGPGSEGTNKASRLIKVTEHYVRMDYEDNGKAQLYCVTTGGDDSEVLSRDGEDDARQVDVIPIAAMTPIIVTHRFFGRSVADLVMDIQRIKTALMRGMLDNLYLHNNPRVEVPDSHANDVTLDDLLVSRPGGVVRTKTPGGLAWQTVPDITPSIYPALQYMDSLREWRTGVSRQGQGLDANALQNQTATAAAQLFTAAQARMKLIARIFAETGIRDLFSLLHMVIRKNGSQADTIRLRNTWVTVDPRNWKTRDDMTITVGLGTGGKTERLTQLMGLIALQEKGIAAGLVSKKGLWNSAQEYVKLMGRKDPEAFFVPPQSSQPGQPDQSDAPIPTPPDPKMAEMQAKAEIEKLQAQADIETNNRKTQAEMVSKDRELQFKMAADERDAQRKAALEQQKFELERELKLIDAQLKMKEHELKMKEHEATLQVKAAEHAMKADDHQRSASHEQQKHDMNIEELSVKAGKKPPKVAKEENDTNKELLAFLQKAQSPKRVRVIRDKAGKIAEVEQLA